MSQVGETSANTEVDESLDDHVSEGGERGDCSEGEGDVEIEQVSVDDNIAAHQDSSHHISGEIDIASFDARRRTVISLWQRAILEKYYQDGMTSASQLLAHFHTAVAEQTGLALTVVKNWIRNRRRPTAIITAEKLSKVVSSFPSPSQAAPPLLSMPSVTQMNTTISGHTAPAVTASGRGTETSRNLISPSSLPPQVKRACLEQPPPLSLPSPYQSPQSASLQTTTYSSSLSPTSMSAPMLVKVRVADSGENDFIEVELPALSYAALLNACCEEMEIQPSEIAKIRKLPNIWVRKDKDVQRMKDGQELEVILNSTTSAMNALLSVNPFNCSNAVTMFSTQRSEHESSLLAPLTTELPPSIPDIPTAQINGRN